MKEPLDCVKLDIPFMNEVTTDQEVGIQNPKNPCVRPLSTGIVLVNEGNS